MAIKHAKEDNEDIVYRTPAAIAANARGEDTYVIIVAKRYDEDRERYVCVDNNPPARIPTDEAVEVAENEYFSLKAAAELRKSSNRLLEKLSHAASKSAAI